MRLEAEVAQVCGVANAAAGRLVALIADVLATGSWEGADILSPAHWVGWKCGVSAKRACRLVSMARRLPELPETRAAFEAGELSEDQVALICRHAPAAADASVAEFARHATHSQLSRVLSKYVFENDKKRTRARASPGRLRPRRRRLVAVLGGTGIRGRGQGPAGPGAGAGTPEARLLGRRPGGGGRALPGRRPRHPGPPRRPDGGGPPPPRRQAATCTWARACPTRCCATWAATAGSRPSSTITGGWRSAWAGPCASCPSAPAWSSKNATGAVGSRGVTTPPGCRSTTSGHWLDGGPTDTWNLVALCSHHHRLHHQGKFDIEGNADDPDGLVFTDRKGRRLMGCGRPAPPGDTVITGNWTPPSGERLDSWMVTFDEVPVGA